MKDTKAISFFVSGILVGGLLATTGFAFYLRTAKQAAEQRSLDQAMATMDATGEPEAAAKAEAYVLKLGHGLDSSHPVHLSMEYMKTRVEELSNGALTIDIYPSGQLGPETQCIEQLQNGSLAMTKTSAAAMENFVPEMAVFSLPYVFRDSEHYWNVLNSDLGKELLQKGKDKKLMGLCYYDAGSRNFYTRDKAIKTPADLDGLKIRVMATKTAMDMVEAMGGAPTPTSWGELYTALQQGMVDGAENNWPSFVSAKHSEVCKHFSMDAHSRVPDMLIIGEKTWEKLPEKFQQVLQQAADDSSVYERKLWKEKSEEARKVAEEDGVQVYEVDVAAFAEVVQPLLKAQEGTPVGDLLEQIKEVE